MLYQKTQEQNDEAPRAAVEKFPTSEKQRKYMPETNVFDERKLDMNVRGRFIDRALKVHEEDNERFLTTLRSPIDEVGIKIPTVEVRFKNLRVEADCFIGDCPKEPKLICQKAFLVILKTFQQASGEITYNGHKLDEFVPQKTSAYVSQNDVHVAEMTVGEILDFSARCQGIGSRYVSYFFE
ncbi:hypothetical protein ACS0TY_032316 [Phlomoides rotata]